MSRLPAALALAVTIAGGSADPAFTPASLPPGEAKRSTDEFRARAFAPNFASLGYLFACVTDLTESRYGQAQRDCSQAIRIYPDNPGGYKLRGEASLFQGRFEVALEDLNQAIALDATDDESFAARAQAFRLLGDVPRAIADFDRAIVLAPDKPQYWNGRCWIRAEANIELAKALADCNKAHALSLEFAAALDSRGFVYLRLKRYARAIRDYDQAILLQPVYPSALFGRGIAKLHVHRIASGRADIRKARALDPGVDTFFARMGVTLRGTAVSPSPPHREPPPAKPSDAYAVR